MSGLVDIVPILLLGFLEIVNTLSLLKNSLPTPDCCSASEEIDLDVVEIMVNTLFSTFTSFGLFKH